MEPSDYRYNPFSDSPSHVNFSERRLIPNTSPYCIKLNEVPFKSDPSNLQVVEIDEQGEKLNDFIEVAATPAAGQFRPDYNTGADGDEGWNTGTLLFSSSDAGKFIEISYSGTGTLASVKAPKYPSWMTDYGNSLEGNIVAQEGEEFYGLRQVNSFVVPEGVTAYAGIIGVPLKILSRGAVIIKGRLSAAGRGTTAALGRVNGAIGDGAGRGGNSSTAQSGGAVYYSDICYYNGINVNLNDAMIDSIAYTGEPRIGSGGAGSQYAGGTNYFGGSGGNGILIVAPEVYIQGEINASGGDATGRSPNTSGGGGGGGSIIIATKHFYNGGIISVSGGNPAAGYAEVGGDGWYRIFELGEI